MDPLFTAVVERHADLLSPSSTALFEQFLNGALPENVTPDTIDWYETAFKAFRRTLSTVAPPIIKSSLQSFVVKMRQRDVKRVSVNTYIKALNAFCRWLHQEGHLAERLELPLLKLEKRVLQTLSDEQVTALLARKPKGFVACRLHALVVFVLDTGVRIEEALTARVNNVDYDNLLVTVFGKGRKERRIPFSFELRKVLFRFPRERLAQCPRCELLFRREPARVGPGKRTPRSASDRGEARPTHARLASPPPRLCDQLPPPRRRHRAPLDGARALADHHAAVPHAPMAGPIGNGVMSCL
jgi:integrase/recombinase XerD